MNWNWHPGPVPSAIPEPYCHCISIPPWSLISLPVPEKHSSPLLLKMTLIGISNAYACWWSGWIGGKWWFRVVALTQILSGSRFYEPAQWGKQYSAALKWLPLVSHSQLSTDRNVRRNAVFRWSLLQRIREGFWVGWGQCWMFSQSYFMLSSCCFSPRNGVMLTAWGVWASQILPTLLMWRRLKTRSPVSNYSLFPRPELRSLSQYCHVSRPKGSRLWAHTDCYSLCCFFRGWISQECRFFPPWEKLCAEYKTAFNWGLWTPGYARCWVNGCMCIFWVDFTVLRTADTKEEIEVILVSLFLRWQQHVSKVPLREKAKFNLCPGKCCWSSQEPQASWLPGHDRFFHLPHSFISFFFFFFGHVFTVSGLDC